MYNILSVTSYSGVGKTTLIENIVKILTDRGYKIGTIKHTCHDIDIDQEGKDSYKHRKAGASKVCVVSKNRVSFIEERREERNLKDIIKLYNDMDLIIIEGYKKYKFKKLEIIRSDKYNEIISDKEDLIGIIIDLNYQMDIVKFNLDEYINISNFIEECIDNDILLINEDRLDFIIK